MIASSLSAFGLSFKLLTQVVACYTSNPKLLLEDLLAIVIFSYSFWLVWFGLRHFKWKRINKANDEGVYRESRSEW